jgi:hypothetical protein
MRLFGTNRIGRIAAGIVLPLAAFGLLASPVLAGHGEGHGHGKAHKKIEIRVTPDGDADGTVIDASDLEVGETRYITSESGKEIAITREENGFRIDIDGEETFVMSPLEGMHKKVMLRAMGEGEAHAESFVVTGEGEGHNMIFVTDDHQTVHLDDLENTVFISGLGDLDDYDKERIIDALRSAGVDKEIHFTPGGGAHGFHFLTTSGVVGEGGDGEIEVEVRKFGPGEDDGNVFVIEKKVVTEEEE